MKTVDFHIYRRQRQFLPSHSCTSWLLQGRLPWNIRLHGWLQPSALSSWAFLLALNAFFISPARFSLLPLSLFLLFPLFYPRGNSNIVTSFQYLKKKNQKPLFEALLKIKEGRDSFFLFPSPDALSNLWVLISASLYFAPRWWWMQSWCFWVSFLCYSLCFKIESLQFASRKAILMTGFLVRRKMMILLQVPRNPPPIFRPPSLLSPLVLAVDSLQETLLPLVTAKNW